MKKVVLNLKKYVSMRCFCYLKIVVMILATLFTSCDKDGDKLVKYTVSFDSNGGTAVKSQKIKELEVVVKPEDPKRNGYLFIAWYRDAALTNEWDFRRNYVLENVTLYAAW